MPTSTTTQNGTTPGHSLPPDSGSLASTAPESQGIANNAENSPSDLVTNHDGRQLHPTRAQLNSGSSDSISSHRNINSDDFYDSDDASDDSYGSDPRPSKRRGDGPKGDWKARALEVNWASSASIEELIPPYAGERYGKEPFPIVQLLDVRGNVNPDPYWCYQRVSDWRRLRQRRQLEELEFQRNLDKAIKDKYKKMKAKKLHEEEKARKAADKVARKAATDARRIENRRNKRQREREAAAFSAAGGDDTRVLDEEVCVSFLYLLHSNCNI